MIKWALQDNEFGLDNHLRAFESLKNLWLVNEKNLQTNI